MGGGVVNITGPTPAWSAGGISNPGRLSFTDITLACLLPLVFSCFPFLVVFCSPPHARGGGQYLLFLHREKASIWQACIRGVSMCKTTSGRVNRKPMWHRAGEDTIYPPYMGRKKLVGSNFALLKSIGHPPSSLFVRFRGLTPRRGFLCPTLALLHGQQG